MLHAATLTKDPNEQLKFYQTTAGKFPEMFPCYRITWLYIIWTLGKTDDAIAAFEKAKAIQNNDVIKNNLGFGCTCKR